jgi:hypothetical protein
MKITPKQYKKVYFIWLKDNGCIVKDYETSKEIGRTDTLPNRVEVYLTDVDDKRLDESISRIPSCGRYGSMNIRYKGSDYGLFYDMTKEQYFIEWC